MKINVKKLFILSSSLVLISCGNSGTSQMHDEVSKDVDYQSVSFFTEGGVEINENATFYISHDNGSTFVFPQNNFPSPEVFIKNYIFDSGYEKNYMPNNGFLLKLATIYSPEDLQFRGFKVENLEPSDKACNEINWRDIRTRNGLAIYLELNKNLGHENIFDCKFKISGSILGQSPILGNHTFFFSKEFNARFVPGFNENNEQYKKYRKQESLYKRHTLEAITNIDSSLSLSNIKLKDINFLSIAYDYIKKIDLSDSDIENLSILEKMTKLEELDVSHKNPTLSYKVPHLQKIFPYLAKLETLKKIVVSNLVPGTEVLTNLNTFFGEETTFPYVKELDLSGNQIVDFEDIPRKFPNLEVLNLANTGLTNINSIVSSEPNPDFLKKLKALNISDNKIENFYFLASMPEIESLNVSNTGFNSLYSIQKLQSEKLKELFLANDKIPWNEFSLLKDFPHLEKLNLYNTGFSDLSLLEHLNASKMTELDVGKGKYPFNGFETLNNFTNLKKLSLRDVGLKNLSFLSHMALSLKDLDIGYNDLRNLTENDINFLSETKLSALDISTDRNSPNSWPMSDAFLQKYLSSENARNYLVKLVDRTDGTWQGVFPTDCNKIQEFQYEVSGGSKFKTIIPALSRVKNLEYLDVHGDFCIIGKIFSGMVLPDDFLSYSDKDRPFLTYLNISATATRRVSLTKTLIINETKDPKYGILMNQDYCDFYIKGASYPDPNVWPNIQCENLHPSPRYYPYPDAENPTL